MKQENIFNAIMTSMACLEESMMALARKDEKKVKHFTWRAASDLEYALFLFSLMHQDEKEWRSWKLDPKSRQLGIQPLLVSAQHLLEEARDSLEAGKVHEAHKRTWKARGQLLKVHDLFEKESRREEKASS